MSLISPAYRELNAEMHRTREDFGVSGGKWAPVVIELAHSLKARSILDYGCGRGLLKLAIKEAGYCNYYEVQEYDPAILEKAATPRPAELVYCGDVMEHVERDFVSDVLDDIQQLAISGAMFVISTAPAGKNLPDGRNTHVTIEGPDWWLPQIMERWELNSFKRLGGRGFVAVGLCRR